MDFYKYMAFGLLLGAIAYESSLLGMYFAEKGEVNMQQEKRVKLEKEIQAEIMVYLRGYHPIKLVIATKSSEPDIICSFNGRFTAIEVKVPGKKPTKSQAEKLYDIRLTQGLAMYATSVQDVKDHLEGNRTDLFVENWYDPADTSDDIEDL